MGFKDEFTLDDRSSEAIKIMKKFQMAAKFFFLKLFGESLQ